MTVRHRGGQPGFEPRGGGFESLRAHQLTGISSNRSHHTATGKESDPWASSTSNSTVAHRKRGRSPRPRSSSRSTAERGRAAPRHACEEVKVAGPWSARSPTRAVSARVRSVARGRCLRRRGTAATTSRQHYAPPGSRLTALRTGSWSRVGTGGRLAASPALARRPPTRTRKKPRYRAVLLFHDVTYTGSPLTLLTFPSRPALACWQTVHNRCRFAVPLFQVGGYRRPAYPLPLERSAELCGAGGVDCQR